MEEIIKKEFTCICCPIGCRILVEKTGEQLKITGNNCPKGEKYVRDEMLNPKRVLTSIVRVTGGEIPVLSVKTKGEVPKDKIWECVNVLRDISVKAPIKCGDMILENILGTGIDIVATKDVEVKNREGQGI